MGKIYNIHSKTLSEKDIKQISESIDTNKHIFLLNEDFRYEVIDLDRGTSYKSGFLRNLLIPYYVVIKLIKRIRGKE